MILFRQIKKRTLLLWTLLLSLALLCAQGVKLHVHSLDHDHVLQHDHIAIEVMTEHSHLSEAHLSSDVSHGDHHDEVVSELDASPDGFLKKVSSTIVLLALFATALALRLGFYPQKFHRHRDEGTILPWRYLFSQPPRAPPL